MTDNLFAPDAPPLGRPYWWNDGIPLPDLPELVPTRSDIVIVGGGFTGLSAALTCADAGKQVVVVDAEIPGEGASTRNGGMFGAHPRLSYEVVVSRFGEDTANELFRESRLAFDFTKNLIEREGINCDFQRTGRIQLAWTRADFEAQKRLVAAATERADLEMELLDRETLATEISTDLYFGAIRFPGHGALHPRKFHDGLLAAALRRAVRVIPNCPVRSVGRATGGFIAETAGGTIRTEKVILATNGYTRGAFGWFRRRVFPLPSFIIATEPLSPDLIQHLAPGRRMMVETRARHSYFRISPDGSRILFGGRAAMTPMAPDHAAARLHRTMCDIWPALKEIRLTHSWTGNTGYTFSHMPQVGCHEGVHFACGYSGSGVATAPYLGMKVAYQALGDPQGKTAYSRTTLTTRPFHVGGTPWFLYAGEFWYRNVVDRLEYAAARRDRRA